MANVVNSGAMDEFLKENVYPELQDSINLRSMERQLFAGIQKGAVEGKWFRLSILTKGNFRFEGRGERDTLPGTNTATTNANDVAADVDGIESKFYRKQMYSVVQVSGPAYRAGMGAGGFEELGKLVLKQTMEGLPESVSRQWATGQASPLARVTSFSTTTLTLTPATGITNETDAFPWLGNRYLREGMVIDFAAANILGAIRNDTAKNERGRQITALSDDTTTATATLDATLATSAIAAGDVVVPFAARTANAVAAVSAASDMESKWPSAMGILDAVQNSTDSHYSIQYYGTLDRTAAANRIMQSRIIKNTTLTALTVAMINRLFELIRLDPLGPGEEPEIHYCHPSVYRKFIDGQNLTAAFSSNTPQRFVNPGANFKPQIGVTGVRIQSIGSKGAIEAFVSPFAPMYRWYSIARKYLMMLEEAPLGPLDLDGQTWRMAGGTTDDWRMFLGWYCTGIINKKPNASGYITGLTGDQNTA